MKAKHGSYRTPYALLLPIDAGELHSQVMNHSSRISPLLSLTVELSNLDELGAWGSREGASAGGRPAAVVLARVAAIRLWAGGDRTGDSRRCFGPAGVVFLPRALSELFLDQALQKVSEKDPVSCGRIEAWKSSKGVNLTLLEPTEVSELSSVFMSFIHPSLCKTQLKGVLLLSDEAHSPADLVLFDLSQAAHQEIQVLMDDTNGRTIQNTMYGDLLLKVIIVANVFVGVQQKQTTANKCLSSDSVTDQTSQSFDVPTCPICLHRIDPARLGLLKPHVSHLCSNFCPPPHVLRNGEMLHNACSKQQLLNPWPDPSRCACCRCIEAFWRRGPLETAAPSVAQSSLELADLFCYRCPMQETLWVCMTCGFVGCGRYSNKHAAEHFYETNHPYSLELATLRIWDYVESEYVHRTDLLECPSSPPLMHPLRLLANPSRSVLEQSSSGLSVSSDVADAVERGRPFAMNPMGEKTPKKASMIGEEYEALLQSALEDQAQHYEGELSRLRASLTAERVDASQLTEIERTEMERLQNDIIHLRSEIDAVSREVLSAQAQEAGHRAISQRLLREQQVAQELIAKVKEKTIRERENGRRQIDELEQQIADLTANQRMRHTFAQDEELANAQLFGAQNTSRVNTSDKTSWKKSKRIFRR